MIEGPRSPIKDKPLRGAGQSLDEQLRQLIEDKVLTPLLIALFLSILAAMEWYRYISNAPPAPWHASTAAVLAIAFAAWRFYRIRLQARLFRQGIDGEKAVGQFLDRLREQGYRVYHDILGASFNVDHVLIGPGGIFSIETKTWSKPAKGEARLQFDGERITRGSHEPERNPVIQAKAQASWLREVIADSTGKKFDVKPVILFPGWFIEQSNSAFKQIWVLNPKAIEDFLANEPVRLSEEDIKLASFHLSRFIRANEAERDRR